MSSSFLQARCAKVLICAGNDRLDRELMIAHMQGKFQVHLVPASGHVVEVSYAARSTTLLNAPPSLYPASILSVSSMKNSSICLSCSWLSACPTYTPTRLCILSLLVYLSASLYLSTCLSTCLLVYLSVYLPRSPYVCSSRSTVSVKFSSFFFPLSYSVF